MKWTNDTFRVWIEEVGIGSMYVDFHRYYVFDFESETLALFDDTDEEICYMNRIHEWNLQDEQKLQAEQKGALRTLWDATRDSLVGEYDSYEIENVDVLVDRKCGQDIVRLAEQIQAMTNGLFFLVDRYNKGRIRDISCSVKDFAEMIEALADEIIANEQNVR